MPTRARFFAPASVALAAAALGALLVPGARAAVPEADFHSPTMEAVAQVVDENFEATDIEFAVLGGRQHAVVGSYGGGMRLIDISDPTNPTMTGRYDCGIWQGDVQVFEREGRTYATYTADSGYKALTETQCYREIGWEVGDERYGTFIVDITDPAHPETVTLVPIENGSHNQTVHPSGRYLYNSSAQLGPANIEVIDIADLRNPEQVFELELTTGLASHDVTFNADGTRAYSAALTHTLVIDTTDPAAPSILGRIVDPTINIHHQSDPITLVDPVLGERTFLIVTDELAGAAGNFVCPGGGLHVYEVTGPLEMAPVKVGFWAAPDLRTVGVDGADASSSSRCTSHVLRIHPDEQLMTIAWYGLGTRVVDVSGLVGVSAGVEPAIGKVELGMKELGYALFHDSEAWAAKAVTVSRTEPFHIFTTDMIRGLDVFRFTPPDPMAAAASEGDAGRWLQPAQVPLADAVDGSEPFCVIGREAVDA